METLFIEINGLKIHMREGSQIGKAVLASNGMKVGTIEKVFFVQDTLVNNGTRFVRTIAKAISKKYGVKNFKITNGLYSEVSFSASEVGMGAIKINGVWINSDDLSPIQAEADKFAAKVEAEQKAFLARYAETTKEQKKSELLAMLDARRANKPLGMGHYAKDIIIYVNLLKTNIKAWVFSYNDGINRKSASEFLAELHRAFYYELSDSQLDFASKLFERA